MEEKLDNLFYQVRENVFKLIQEKNVDVDDLAFNLGIGRQTFIDNFNKRIDDFSFYLQTISLLKHWEV